MRLYCKWQFQELAGLQIAFSIDVRFKTRPSNSKERTLSPTNSIGTPDAEQKPEGVEVCRTAGRYAGKPRHEPAGNADQLRLPFNLMVMAKSFQLNEVVDCENGISGMRSLENAGRNGFAPSEPSAETKFLNERAIWLKALAMAMLPENSSD